MILTVNGSPQEVPDDGTVADLVEERLGDRAACGVAVAVNDTVVGRSTWADRRLRAGDRLDIVTAVQGG